MKVRGAFEAITGLEGYADQNYMEISAEAGLTLPNLKLPLWKRHPAAVESSSEVSVMYDSQNRPEFHRRVLTGALRYRWTNKKTRMQHRLDLVDLNYIFMPWISETFKNDYLDDEENRNAILRYNYENLFIVKQGYSLVYNSQGDAGPNASYGKNATAIRFNLETAGNLFYGLSNLFRASRDNSGQFTLFNIAYAQYVKGDLDFSRSFKFDERNSLAIHAALEFPIRMEIPRFCLTKNAISAEVPTVCAAGMCADWVPEPIPEPTAVLTLSIRRVISNWI